MWLLEWSNVCAILVSQAFPWHYAKGCPVLFLVLFSGINSNSSLGGEIFWSSLQIFVGFFISFLSMSRHWMCVRFPDWWLPILGQLTEWRMVILYYSRPNEVLGSKILQKQNKIWKSCVRLCSKYFRWRLGSFIRNWDDFSCILARWGVFWMKWISLFEIMKLSEVAKDNLQQSVIQVLSQWYFSLHCAVGTRSLT